MFEYVIHKLFHRHEMPGKIPAGMQLVIDELSRSKSKEECLRKAYAVITGRYYGSRIFTMLLLWRLFTNDIGKLWGRKGFMHCTQQNHLMAVLLVKSGLFREKDIAKRWTRLFYISPHQYLDVALSGTRVVHVDTWGAAYGINLGGYAHGFHMRS